MLPVWYLSFFGDVSSKDVLCSLAVFRESGLVSMITLWLLKGFSAIS